MKNLPKAFVGVHSIRWIATYPLKKVIQQLGPDVKAVILQAVLFVRRHLEKNVGQTIKQKSKSVSKVRSDTGAIDAFTLYILNGGGGGGGAGGLKGKRVRWANYGGRGGSGDVLPRIILILTPVKCREMHFKLINEFLNY